MSGKVLMDMEDLKLIINGPVPGERILLDLGETTLLDGEEVHMPTVLIVPLDPRQDEMDEAFAGPSPLDRLDSEGCKYCGDLDQNTATCANCAGPIFDDEGRCIAENCCQQ